jgi:hypothetical protein
MGRANCSNESACFTIAYTRLGLTPEQMELANESIAHMARSADRRILWPNGRRNSTAARRLRTVKFRCSSWRRSRLDDSRGPESSIIDVLNTSVHIEV